MFKDFLNKLKPVNTTEQDEWQNILKECDNEFDSKEPVLFWYLSSGIDLKALVHFSEKDTNEVYNTPTIDIFIYSDYGGITKKLRKYYDELDNGLVTLYRDYQTHISLEQMIPLQYFSNNEVYAINEKYKDNRHPSIRDKIISDEIHFYYCFIEIKSNYFSNEYFPLLISPIENWVLLEEVWKKQRVLFDYICGVCDGCRKGGAYKCVNVNYKDFLTIMKRKRFWVSDHIHWSDILPNDEFEKTFHQIAKLKGWGQYNSNISYLYEIITKNDTL